MAIEWTPNLSVGVKSIDDQHKELFRRVNRLLEAANQGRGKGELGTTIRFLSDYVIIHFQTEELAMARHEYAGMSAHKAEHQAFIRDFDVLAKSFQTDGASTSLVVTLQRRVVDWLINHIGKSDKALGAVLASRAA